MVRLTTALLESCAGESEGEFSSILASLLVFLRSLDHLIRPSQYVRRNREADLLRSLEIDYQLELGGLFHWQIGRLSVRPTAVTRAWINSTDAR